MKRWAWLILGILLITIDLTLNSVFGNPHGEIGSFIVMLFGLSFLVMGILDLDYKSKKKGRHE